MNEQELEDRVQKSALLLDQELPGWENHIDLDNFDMCLMNRCVCGQLNKSTQYKGNPFSQNRAFSLINRDGTYLKGINESNRDLLWLKLGNYWKKEIMNRKTKGNDITWVKSQILLGKKVKRTKKQIDINNLTQEDLLANDWVLDNRIELCDVPAGGKFTYKGKTYTAFDSDQLPPSDNVFICVLEEGSTSIEGWDCDTLVTLV